MIRNKSQAMGAVRRLARAQEDRQVAALAEDLGARILALGGVGLRDGYSHCSKTYDLCFVGTRAFATFIAPTHKGSWNKASSAALTVEVRFQHPDDNPCPHILKPKPTPDVERGWHVGHLVPGDNGAIEELLNAIARAKGPNTDRAD